MNRRQFLALTAMTPLLPLLGSADVDKQPEWWSSVQVPPGSRRRM